LHLTIGVLFVGCAAESQTKPWSQINDPVERFNALRTEVLDEKAMEQNEKAKQEWNKLRLGKEEPRPVFRNERERIDWETWKADQELFDAYQEKEEFEQWKAKLRFFSTVELSNDEAEAFWTRYNRRSIESTDWELIADIVMQVQFARKYGIN